MIRLANIISHFVAYILISLIVSFEVPFINISFYVSCYWYYIEENCLKQKFVPMVSSIIFIVLGFTLRSNSSFRVNFISWVISHNSFFSHTYSIVPDPLIKMIIFFILNYLWTFIKVNWLYEYESISGLYFVSTLFYLCNYLNLI